MHFDKCNLADVHPPQSAVMEGNSSQPMASEAQNSQATEPCSSDSV